MESSSRDEAASAARATTGIEWLRTQLLRGAVIPAHPLALTEDRKLDVRYQKALTRYYCASGVGGLAVGVHTTQFAIRDPRFSLLRPVLQLAMDVMMAERRPLIKIAGVCGDTMQAEQEATLAKEIGYDAALLSLGVWRAASDSQMIAHVRAISEILPIVGFYLQPDVGGRVLGYSFWRQFFEIDRVVAVKVAPFHRYRTLDVVRALADSGRASDIALYTGNDDNIVADLLTEFVVGEQRLRFVGGLLGHWAIWTRRAVELLEAIRACHERGGTDAYQLLAHSAPITDMNAALFDAANGFAGCIAGIHAVLHEQGLMAGTWCLDPEEALSPGQYDEIQRVRRSYPEWIDDTFVSEKREEWLRDN